MEVSRNYFWGKSVELPWWRVTTHADLESATDWLDARAKFASRNQKHYPGTVTLLKFGTSALVPRTSSGDVISRGNQSCCREMSAVFLRCSKVLMYLLKFARKISLIIPTLKLLDCLLRCLTLLSQFLLSEKLKKSGDHVLLIECVPTCVNIGTTWIPHLFTRMTLSLNCSSLENCWRME